MTEYTVRSMSDDALDELIQRLDREVKVMSLASTKLGKKPAAQYSGALIAARLERDRRNRDWVP
jgi:hypothetical protein